MLREIATVAAVGVLAGAVFGVAPQAHAVSPDPIVQAGFSVGNHF